MLDNESRFWLTLWITLALIGATVAISVPYIISRKDVAMAEAGYVQKVVVIGNPNDSYSRHIEVVWVKVGTEPSVESK
jgi:hypothetical protein